MWYLYLSYRVVFVFHLQGGEGRCCRQQGACPPLFSPTHRSWGQVKLNIFSCKVSGNAQHILMKHSFKEIVKWTQTYFHKRCQVKAIFVVSKHSCCFVATLPLLQFTRFCAKYWPKNFGQVIFFGQISCLLT